MFKKLTMLALVFTSLLVGFQSISFAEGDAGEVLPASNIDYVECGVEGSSGSDVTTSEDGTIVATCYGADEDVTCVYPGDGSANSCYRVPHSAKPRPHSLRDRMKTTLPTAVQAKKAAPVTPKPPSLRDRMKTNKAKLPATKKVAPATVAPVKKVKPATKMKKPMAAKASSNTGARQ